MPRPLSPVRWLPVIVTISMLFAFVLHSQLAHAATLSVSNTNGSGPGSLRQAILDTNAAGNNVVRGLTIVNFSQNGITPTATPTVNTMLIPQTWIVNTLSDASIGSCANVCSLRDALTLANSGDTINIAVAGTIVLTAALPDITAGGAGITINGNPTTIQSSVGIRSFTVSSTGVATFNHLTITWDACTLPCTPLTNGGSVYNTGALTINNSAIRRGNSSCFANCAPPGFGGGVYNAGTLTVTYSTFSGNWAYQGGGVYNKAGTVTIIGSDFSGNVANYGGGVYNKAGTVTINNSIFAGNSDEAAYGGGIYFEDGTFNITDSTFSGNQAAVGGAVLGFGGTLNITSSTFSGNHANAGGGVSTGRGSDGIAGAVNIINSTFFGNSAAGDGGGIINNLPLTITSSTFYGNSAGGQGGGIYSLTGAFMRNTIVTASTGGDCAGNFSNPGSANNRTTDTCVGNLGPVTGISASLADNGGPTQTLALLPGSNAIDQTDAACLVAADQRGITRPQGAGCDIGAFEFVSPPTPTPTFTDTPVPASYPNTILADGPISYWRLGETGGTTAADVMGVNPGTITGGVTLGVTGALASDGNPAMRFNGSNSYVNVPHNAVLNIKGDITLEAWANPAVLNSLDRMIVHKGGYQYRLGLNNSNKWYGRVYISGSPYDVVAPTTAAVGRWDYIAMTRSGSTLTLYINGVAVATGTASGSLVTTSNALAIGRKGSLSEAYFNGAIDEVAIYNKALTADQIAAHYNAGQGSAIPTPTNTNTPTASSTFTLTPTATNIITVTHTPTAT
ncbi:MAG: hypothetical protein IT324_29050, partial [Anaerolineae bacterium]|nr:hypothetical protein [Anaerolineae bacterium]